MRVSLEWLSQYVDIKDLSPEAIAEALTNAGLEVEAIEQLGGRFSGVVVGKVEAVEPHPNADRLRLATVNLGPLGSNQVVCGASNLTPGMIVPYAQIGASVISRKDNQLFELTPAVIRGVQSTGMLCSIGELGLEDQFTVEEDGLWPIHHLTTPADLGRDLKAVLQLTPDTVLDVTPNANRGDLMSMIGVAREVAALFQRPLTLPQPPVLQSKTPSPFQVELPEPQVCQYYAGAVLNQVQLKPSPDWIRHRLQSAGIRALNNVVDITNYVMLETGQPLHAFDANQLGNKGTINVRSARASETLVTLDNIERTLSPQNVVVTHHDKPIALAGVMGGAETEISDSTQRVFLESALFPPASNRKNARAVGLRTEASARYERGIDPEACVYAFNRAIQLLQEHANASLESVASADHRHLQPLKIDLSQARLEKILGLSIPTERIEQSLSLLGFSMTSAETPGQWNVSVPSFRQHDVTREIDLIEEIIRIYGYDQIPYHLPQESGAPTRSYRSHLLNHIRSTLMGSGLTEVATLSLIGDNILKQTGFSQDPETTVSVTNSHSVDHTFLRQSLIPNLLEVARYNQAQGNESLWCFELGKTYAKVSVPEEKSAGVSEPLYLSGLMMGSLRQGEWHERLETDFYSAKGVIESLLGQLNLLSSARWMSETDMESLHPGQSTKIKLGKQDFGFVGRLHPALQERLKIKHHVYLFEFNVEILQQVLEKKQEQLVSAKLSAFPFVKRDIAFLAPLSVTHQQILSAFNQAQEPLLQTIELFDEYRSPQLGEENRSLAYRMTLQSAQETLTDQQIDQAIDKLKQQLAKQLPVTYR